MSGSVRFGVLATANVEGWTQLGELGLALLLAAAVGLEREIRLKSAGLRTHTLVGAGAALFMLISKYGFDDVASPGRVELDPSRMAAQIVSGVGFLGAGLIFQRGGSIRGLTAAASIWLTAGIGSAAGAGLPLLAVGATVVYFVVALVFPAVTRHLPRSSTAVSALRVRYPDGRGVLRRLLQVAAQHGFAIDEVATNADGAGGHMSGEGRSVEVVMHVHGRASVATLAAAFSELDGVSAVVAADVNTIDE